MALDRLQKIISQAGILSRRKAEELITLGEVTVNGKVAKLGDKAELGKDAIKVQGRLLKHKEPPIYLAFNKPKNVISMLGDPQGRPSLAEYLTKIHSKLFPIGRLDFGSEGLILLTNDGDFAEKVQKNEKILRVYQVKVKGHPDQAMLAKIAKGGRVEDKMISFQSVKLLEEFTAKARIQLVVEGAGAADIKAFFELKRFSVDRIVRTAIGHITLRGLKPGSFRYLTPTQAQALILQPELGTRSVEEGRVSSSDREKLQAAKRAGVDANKPKIFIKLGEQNEDGSRSSPVKLEKVRRTGGWGATGEGRSSATRSPRNTKSFSDSAPRGNDRIDRGVAFKPRGPKAGGPRPLRDGEKFTPRPRPDRDGERFTPRPRPERGGEGFKSRGPRPERDSSYGAPRGEGFKPRSEGFKPRGPRPERDGERPRTFGGGAGARSEGSMERGAGYKPRGANSARPYVSGGDRMERGAGYKPRGAKPSGPRSFGSGGPKPKRPTRR